jgi:hypothetical protein
MDYMRYMQLNTTLGQQQTAGSSRVNRPRSTRLPQDQQRADKQCADHGFDSLLCYPARQGVHHHDACVPPMEIFSSSVSCSPREIATGGKYGHDDGDEEATISGREADLLQELHDLEELWEERDGEGHDQPEKATTLGSMPCIWYKDGAAFLPSRMSSMWTVWSPAFLSARLSTETLVS